MTAASDSANRPRHTSVDQAPIGHTPQTRSPVPIIAIKPVSLTPGEHLLLARFVELVRDAVAPTTLERVTLFGSRARGTSHRDSDLDVAVFVTWAAASRPNQRQLAHRLAEIADQAQAGWEDLPLLRPILIAADQPIKQTLLAAIEIDGVQLWP